MRYAFVLVLAIGSIAAAQERLQSSDLLKLRSVTAVALSPDATRVAYVVDNNDGAGRPYGQLWIMTLADGKTASLGAGKEPSGNPVWSPDGQAIAYRGRVGDKTGLVIARADGSAPRLLSEMTETNAPLPGDGKSIAWSPDGKRIAFVSSVPGPESAAAAGDPMVITRYLYKPDAGEGLTHFNDNRRLHLFVVDVASARVDQLTDGNHYEHSIDWSAKGELIYLTNQDADEDEFFNYDLFASVPGERATPRRLSATESNEYRPRWSPDGRMLAFEATTRGLTDRETTMEDTHVWVMNADGTNRREVSAIDNRQSNPQWLPGGSAVVFTVQERGMVRLYRAPISCGTANEACKPAPIISERGGVGSFSVARTTVAYALSTPSDLAQLYVKVGDAPAKRMTDLNAAVLGSRRLGEVESFTFASNDNKFQIEAFLTKPVGFDPAKKYPLIVNVHGGPHGQQGPTFNFKNQVYAARGWATLMVNYRGSTGYGQRFADAVFQDQNGNEAHDVLYGVSAAIRRYPWIDRDRMGIEGTSYGGQLSMWIPTQTNIFKAAIPTAGISNIISYNYMTYYNQYEAMEWGVYPHQGDLMDTLLQRSALRHVANNHTPTLLMHGENDNDVPIAETEQYFVALKDVGTEAVMVRYPREGHGIRESKHVVDWIDRSIEWYEKHFPKAAAQQVESPTDAIRPAGRLELFNHQNLDGWYTFLRDHRGEDPLHVFTVQDGVLRISGEEWGGVATSRTYRDYHLVVEWKWGKATWGEREGRARDSGILVHGVGPDGAASGNWLESIESQIIEGGTGDYILVAGLQKSSATAAVRQDGDQVYWQRDGERKTMNEGRINWYGRDPNWKDVLGFRGARDVEHAAGEWNRQEVIARGNTLTTIVNGVTVNELSGSSHTAGKIQIQSEGAEIFVRTVELRPLDER